MCNDFERRIEWEAYKAAVEAAELGLTVSAGPDDLPAAADVRVGDIAPVMLAAGNAVELVPMRWGFTPRRAGGPPVFNFKSEGRNFANSKRCLIPASAFFEFTGKASPKTKWRFALSGREIFVVAGLWREDSQGRAFTMLTTFPGPDITPFHDRQIVVLPPERWGDWLYLNGQDEALLAPLAAGSLTVGMARRGKEAPSEHLTRLAGVVTSQ